MQVSSICLSASASLAGHIRDEGEPRFDDGFERRDDPIDVESDERMES